MGKEIILRPYQEDVIDDTISSIVFGSTDIVVESPPASGKSLLISETAKQLSSNHKKRIVISITISALLDQIAKHLDLVKADYSVLKAGRESEFDPTKSIQLCQAQTLHARLDKLKDNHEDFGACTFIMDEVHREYKTKRTTDILQSLNIQTRIGYTGTPYDESGFALSNCELLRTTTIMDLQNQGYLCPIKYFVPKWAETVDLSSLGKKTNDYSEKELNELINTDAHLRLAIQSMDELNAKTKKTMVFASGIEQADKFTKMLKEAGYNAESYHSKIDSKVGERILNAFINNENFIKHKENQQGNLFEEPIAEDIGTPVECLVSVNKLGIGFDCPDVRLGVQLRPTKIRSLFIQQVMRLARIHPSKKFAEYLDLGQTLSTHGFHTAIYVPPKKTGDRKTDALALQEANSNQLEDLLAILPNSGSEEITVDIYNARIKQIKESLTKDLYKLSIKELAAAYEVSKDHKEIITIGTIIYTYKFGKPVSKTGNEYNYRPESFWSTSTFGSNTDFHVHYSMDEYFEMFPDMKSKWIKALKTRLKTIIKEGKKLFTITGFIKYLAEKHEVEVYGFVGGMKFSMENKDANLSIDFEPSEFNRPYENGHLSTSGYGSSIKHTSEPEDDYIYEDEEIPF